MSVSIGEVLDSLAQVATAASALPAPIGLVARIIGAALSAASAIAKAGQDPVVEIERILSADPLVQKVHAEWADLIAKKFPKTDPAPSAPQTLPSPPPARDDPYPDD